MIIYLIYCRTTGKGYIGQTVQSVTERWYGHRWSAKNRRNLAIDLAIYKYGEADFETTQLASAYSLGELNYLEEFYIRLCNTLSPRGYNVHTGGKNHKCSDETKAKIGASKLGNRYCVGRILSEETRRKIGAVHKGKKLSEEQKSKVGLASSLRSAETRRKVGEAVSRARKARYWNTRPKPQEYLT